VRREKERERERADPTQYLGLRVYSGQAGGWSPGNGRYVPLGGQIEQDRKRTYIVLEAGRADGSGDGMALRLSS
jgi:hypothetical protein